MNKLTWVENGILGQTVCQGGPEEPCYKIAYFRDMTSRVAFWEARQACEMDGGTLLSVENAAEQRHIERLLKELTTTGSGIADGDFWIGLTRSDGESTQEHAGFTSCPDLYRWTDGSVSEFRWAQATKGWERQRADEKIEVIEGYWSFSYTDIHYIKRGLNTGHSQFAKCDLNIGLTYTGLCAYDWFMLSAWRIPKEVLAVLNCSFPDCCNHLHTYTTCAS